MTASTDNPVTEKRAGPAHVLPAPTLHGRGSEAAATPSPQLRDIILPRDACLPGFTSAMEVEADELIEALRASGNAAQATHAGQLWRCQKRREERRRGLRPGGAPCRRISCPACRLRVSKAERKRASEFIQKVGAKNELSCLISLDLAKVSNLQDVPQVLKDFGKKLRDLRKRLGTHDRRWSGLCGLAYAEVAFVENAGVLPPRRRKVVTSLPTRHGDDKTAPAVWAVHIHLLATHGTATHGHDGLESGELLAAIRSLYPDLPKEGAHVQPFYAHLSTSRNAANLGGYASKLRTETGTRGGKRTPWPLVRKVEFWAWLGGQRGGLQPLRFRLGAQKVGDKAA